MGKHLAVCFFCENSSKNPTFTLIWIWRCLLIVWFMWIRIVTVSWLVGYLGIINWWKNFLLMGRPECLIKHTILGTQMNQNVDWRNCNVSFYVELFIRIFNKIIWEISTELSQVYLINISPVQDLIIVCNTDLNKIFALTRINLKKIIFFLLIIFRLHHSLWNHFCDKDLHAVLIPFKFSFE